MQSIKERNYKSKINVQQWIVSLSTNKSKTSWNILNNEIGAASSKKFTQLEYKLGNKIIGTN